MLIDVFAGLVGLIASALVDMLTYGLVCLAVAAVVLPPVLLWQRYRRRSG